MQRISVPIIVWFGRTGINCSGGAWNSYLMTALTYCSGSGLRTVSSSQLSRALFQTKKQNLQVNVRQLMHRGCPWQLGTRCQSSSPDASSSDLSVPSVAATKDTVTQTKFDREVSSLGLSDSTTSDSNSMDPSRELIIYVNGNYTSVKAVDLYSLIRRYNAEEVVHTLIIDKF